MELPTRDNIESKLDDIVVNNRSTIAIIFPLIGSIMMISSAELTSLPEFIKFNSLLILFGVFIMRLPLISGLMPITKKKAVLFISVLILYTYLIEIIGVRTGYPYGEFEYGISLGPMILDIPLALPVFFIPLVINSYLLCLLLFDFTKNKLLRVPTVVITVILIDMILDPAAVALGFWSYESGIYYGVPISNYIGWILSASVATLLIDLSYDYDELKDQIDDCNYLLDDMVSFTIMWGIVNLFYLAIIPVVITLGFIIGLIKSNKFNFVFLDE